MESIDDTHPCDPVAVYPDSGSCSGGSNRVGSADLATDVVHSHYLSSVAFHRCHDHTTGHRHPLDCHNDVVGDRDPANGPGHVSCRYGLRNHGQGARLLRLLGDAQELGALGVDLRSVSKMGDALMVHRMLVSYGRRLSLGHENRRELVTVGEGRCFLALNGPHSELCLIWLLVEFEFLIRPTIRRWVQDLRIPRLVQVACHPFGCGTSSYPVRGRTRSAEFRQAGLEAALS